jgi:competence protein ComEC
MVARATERGGGADGEPLLLRVPDRSRIAAAPPPVPPLPRSVASSPPSVAPSPPGAAPSPGDIVVVRGRLDHLGRFDEIQRRRGALAAVFVDELRPTGDHRGGVLGALDGVRRRAEAGLRAGTPEPIAALAASMVLGREDLIDAETRDAFRASGLAHLLVVSGTNVLLLATLVLAAGALSGLPLRSRLAVALVLVALYVPLTGAGPSIQRAGVMGAAGLVAALAGRPASRVYALGLAAALTLIWNPYAAGDAGWQLSFAAVIGLALWAAPLREWFKRHHVPVPLAEAAGMTVAATIATAPLLASHFGQVSLASLPANLVVAPVVALMMWLGMLACAVAQVASPLAAPLNAVNAPLIGFMDRVADTGAALPGAVLSVQLPAVVGYAVLGAGWLAVHNHTPSVRFVRPRGTNLTLGVWVALAAVAGCAFLTVVGAAGGQRLAPGETEVDFLDVGQGDATLIRRDGRSILFDTGTPQGGIVNRLREVGLERLDVLVITHAEDDHEGAAIQVIDRFRPNLVVNGGAGWDTAVQAALPGAAREVGARIVEVAAGDELRLGALRVAILSPPAAVARLPPSGNPNDRALVAHLCSGAFDLFLPADAESPVTGTLDLPEVEALKVAHHGSDDPGLAAELERLRPRLAAIEVGADNTYGHPTPDTMAALGAVPHLYRTDRDGTVRLHVTATSMWVEN